MRTIRVLDGGRQTTVQDLGRPGHAHEGVPASGAADALSLVVGNRLVGNDDGAAALEGTLRGGSFLFEDDALVALAGAPMEATLGVPGAAARPLETWRAVLVHAGEALRLGAAAWGVRAYVCVAGGIDVPPVLGSRSTHVAAALGGFHGRALRGGDVVPVGTAAAPSRERRLAPDAVAAVESALRRPAVRATDGAHARHFSPEALAAFFAAEWTVTDEADRMGARLDGPALAPPGGGSMTTEGMLHGAVEATPSGQPIVLLADHATTGGYPVVACVASVDLPRLGQLRPRERFRFERVTLDEARRLHAKERRGLGPAGAPPPPGRPGTVGGGPR